MVFCFDPQVWVRLFPIQSNLFRTNTKGPTGFVRNNGSSSYSYLIPGECTVIYPIELQILVLLKRKFVLSVFFLTRFHCSCNTSSLSFTLTPVPIRTFLCKLQDTDASVVFVLLFFSFFSLSSFFSF